MHMKVDETGCNEALTDVQCRSVARASTRSRPIDDSLDDPILDDNLSCPDEAIRQDNGALQHLGDHRLSMP
jgi:hypothetical protein